MRIFAKTSIKIKRMKINVLLLGSGGRESALAWKLAQSEQLERLYVAPGNAGTRAYAENVDLPLHNFAAIKDFIIEHDIKMLVVGPEQPLVDGIRDYFAADAGFRDLYIVGPGKLGATLEGSKDFAKAFMQRHKIPTAAYRSFSADTLAEGKAFLAGLKSPYVLKADGLASGKGVLILNSLQEAEAALEEMLCHAKFGKASSKVVIEEFLSGIEVSVFVLTDGQNYVMLPEAKDYKRIGEGDTGPNTGGMGSVSPVPFFTDSLREKIESRIVRPTIEGLKKDAIPYTGFIFFGLMISPGEEPYVIEYNVRMGDPETQSVMMRIESDLLALLKAACTHRLDEAKMKTKPQTALHVVMAAPGYPDKPQTGSDITLPTVAEGSDEVIFHAGTKLGAQGHLQSSGGRILSVGALGENIEAARRKAYALMEGIEMNGKYCRRDIGLDVSAGANTGAGSSADASAASPQR